MKMPNTITPPTMLIVTDTIDFYSILEIYIIEKLLLVNFNEFFCLFLNLILGNILIKKNKSCVL
jgi:hypothetical protein